ncbi:MAG TPA: nuclease-related domain-containing protein [Ureibacillus sp.]|nr:nuclease-related domain-containing protein [Ureibacillus sp.]
MIVKPRKRSLELQILTSLNNRLELSEKYKSLLHTLKKGYEGEILFESYISKLQNNFLILSDLFLQVNSTNFQLDSIIITYDKIFLYEVKNLEGDYYYDATKDRIYSKTKEIINPLSQVVRAETLLRQILQSLKIHLPIEYNVVFVNQEFTLYGAPLDKPFIYPTQIHRYLKKFESMSTDKINKNSYVAEKLLSLHSSDSMFWQIPPYEYKDLKLGVTCAVCGSFMNTVEGYSCICLKCGKRESVYSVILRSVEEFKLLFPEEKITTNGIFEWCGGITSSRTIMRILNRNFQMVGKYRSTHFV